MTHNASPEITSTTYHEKLQIAGGFLIGLLVLIVGLAVLWSLRRRGLHKACASRPVVLFQTHIQLTWEELQRATASFNRARIVGSGGSSTVYKGRLLDGRQIAVKLLRDDLGLLHTPKQLFLTELAVLGKLRHRNLVKILGYIDSMAVILDYMPMGSLDAFLHPDANSRNNQPRSSFSSNIVDWKARLSILLGIAEGLAYLHHEYDGKLCVIHGDLKPSNVLLDENMEAHIADFGLATIVGALNSTMGLSKALPCWSIGYTAPECVQQGVVSRKADVFSFGMIMLEVMTGERPSSRRLKEGESLVEWVSRALAEGAAERVVAPALASDADVDTILRMGCRCASLSRASRPDMQEVVMFLHRLGEQFIQC